MASATPIAIVGVAAELPGGSWSDRNLDYDEFAKFLLASGQAYGRIPKDYFNVDSFKGPALGQVVTESGSFLKDLQLFDYLEFGVTARDAALMPLSTRKLLETAFLALVDSGIDYRGHNVGCFVSGVAHDVHAVSGHDYHAFRGSFVLGPAMLANRVSYHLDLRGPSFPTNTACSSSLVAAHLAVQALRAGECEAAVVGGCQVNHSFSDWLVYSGGGILSPDGKCKPFDADADGFGRGEGVVSIVLKPLDAALRDHDKIYGTILGTAVNSAGSQAPAGAPVAAAQQEAMQRAFAMAQRSPREVDFVEMHATGTARGDPTEANWVGAQFSREDDELLVGSVKGNIGHLEITAFLASLCKVCAMFRSGLIAPTTNLSTPNPLIHWAEHKMRAPTAVERLPTRARSGRALVAIASSGIGGTNAHCVVEAPPSTRSPRAFWLAESAPVLLLAGGLSPRSAAAVGEALGGLRTRANLPGVARIFGRRARSMTWAAYAISQTGESEGSGALAWSKPVLKPRPGKIVFVYSGQGPQHWNMGRELFATCAPFRESVLELNAIYERIVGRSLISTTGLFGTAKGRTNDLGAVWPIEITLPALTILQLALTDTLAALGIVPDVVVGHSAGETAVVHASGACSKAMVLELSIARARTMALLEERGGTMAALSCDPERARQLVAEVKAQMASETTLDVGCYNTPGAVTLSGAEDAIEVALKQAFKDELFARKLVTRVPVHSGMMEICKDAYIEAVEEVFARHPVSAPTVETYSTKTGQRLTDVFSAEYFWDGARGPVLFTDAITSLLKEHPDATFVEIGPHPVLTGYLGSLAGPTSPVMCPLRRPRRTEGPVEVRTLLDFLGRFVTAGHNTLDFDILCSCGTDLAVTDVPPFPFAPRDVPFFAETIERTRVVQPHFGPLNYPQMQINAQTHPCVAEHVIKGESIMPAAGYLEMALEFGAKRLFDVEFVSMLPLSSERPVPVDIQLDGTEWSVRSASPAEFTKVWPPNYDHLHARGLLSMEYGPEEGLEPLAIGELQSRLPSWEIKGLYDGFAAFAQYGPTYQRITALNIGYDKHGRHEVLIKLRGRDKDLPDVSSYHLHPAITDSAIHILVHPVVSGLVFTDESGYYLPSKVEKVAAHKRLFDEAFPETIYCHAVITEWRPDGFVQDAELVTANGDRLVTITNFEVALHGQTQKAVNSRYDVVMRPLEKPHITPGFESPCDIYQTISPTAWVHKSSAILIDFVVGQEMSVQKLIKDFDSLSERTLSFSAKTGLDGDAMIGFSRALRREYRLCTIGAIVFDESWATAERRRDMATHLMDMKLSDFELFVDADGALHVPRLQELPPPTSSTTFDANKPWTYGAKGLEQVCMPYVPEDHVLVRVTGVVQHADSWWTFLGRVEGNLSPVVGFTKGDITSIVVIHRGALASLPTSSTDVVPCLLASTVGVMSIGCPAFLHPDRLRQAIILVTHCETHIGEVLIKLYANLGLRVVSFKGPATPADIVAYRGSHTVIAISGSVEAPEIRLLEELVASRGRVFLWNKVLNTALSNDPWSIGDALNAALVKPSFFSEHLQPIFELADMLKEQHADVQSPLFDAQKAYILVGGVGSLGLQIARWMYENGARDVTLTSRSGRGSLENRPDSMPRKILSYLETLPDFELHLENANAESIADMTRVVRSMQQRRPLGGGMLLSVVLSDRSFSAQTVESFEVVFKSKLNAFFTFERVVRIPSLDFLISFSSVSALFGNAGQTNYSSANTAVAGLTRKYNNAFSFICPAIVDSNVCLEAIAAGRLAQVRHLTSWGKTARDLCEYIGDAIRRVRDAPLFEYVPDLDWRLVNKNVGSGAMYDHLIPPEEEQETASEVKDPRLTLKETICKMLEVSSEDLYPDVPLTSYGLDSLSAASLSYALRSLLAVSQIQLLAGLTLGQLEERLSLATQ